MPRFTILRDRRTIAVITASDHQHAAELFTLRQHGRRGQTARLSTDPAGSGLFQSRDRQTRQRLGEAFFVAQVAEPLPTSTRGRK